MKPFLLTLLFLSLLLPACSSGSSTAGSSAIVEEQPAQAPPPTATPVPPPTHTPVPTQVPATQPPPPTQAPAATQPPATEQPASASVEITLEILNGSDIEICDIAITPSGQELGDNILDDVFAPGDTLILTDIAPDLYDLLAFDCNDDEDGIVAEAYEVELGQENFSWMIGDNAVAAGPAQSEAADIETTTQPAQPAPADPGGQYAAGACPFDVPDGFNVECGILTVPENRTKENSPTIELPVAILRAPGPNVQPDPIIYLAGGPGGSALVDFVGEPDAWTDYPFSQSRDLVFIDQRGTGYAVPTLNCPEVEAGGEVREAELACHDRLLAAGIDLTAYNTTENAADVAALAQALNYDSWNILGISYGTRLALSIMRDHPQGIRSVVLDSPFPPNADTPSDESVYTMDIFRTLFRDCLNDADCNQAFPNLEAVLIETVDRLNNDPDAEIFGDDLVSTITQSMTAGTDLIVLLPLMIYQVSEGNFELFDELAAESSEGGASANFQGGDEDRSDSEGMYTSVICRDEFAFGDLEQAEARAVAEIPEALRPAIFGNTIQIFELCAAWGAGTAPPRENEAVVSDIPTLIMVGEYDPSTPPVWGKLTAQTLSNGYYFEFRASGHSLLSGVECAIQATNEFITTPNTEPDRSCTNAMEAPFFELP